MRLTGQIEIESQAQPQTADIALTPKRPWLVAIGLLAVGALALQVLASTTQLGSAGVDQAIADWTYRILMAGAAVAVLARAALRSRDRLAWTLIGAGLAAWALGDLYYSIAYADERVIPYPSPSDALYFADYVALVCGVRLLGAHPDARPFSFGLLVTALGLGTVWSWLVFGQVAETAAGGTAAVATTLAYPLFDLLLLGSILLVLAARDWRFDRVLVCLAAGFAVTVLVDSVYAVGVANGTYVDGTALDALWPTGAMLIAAAAWLAPGRSPARPRRDEAIVPVLTSVAIAVAIAALISDHFLRLDSLTILLAGLTLAAGCVQLMIFYRGQRAATSRALRSERLRAASTHAALDCVITIDAGGIVREWNEAATRTFGYSADEALGCELAELVIPPAMRATHREGLARLAVPGETRGLNQRIETVGMRAGGNEFPIELAISRISDDPPMYTGFVRDIGDRRAREAENEWLAAIVRSSEDAIISRDLDGVVTAWNHGAEVLYGWSAEEAIGSRADSLILDVDDELGEMMRKLSAGKVAVAETRRRRKDGELVTVSLRAFPVRDFAGELVGSSAIAHDITERKRREQDAKDDREATVWRSRIEGALDDDRLLFFSQPVVDLRTGSVDHRELLIRMNLDGETISPGAFLPHAERTELITRVDRWAIDRGIELAHSGRVAINLSAKSLDNPPLTERIAAALADPELARNVIFEITETAAAANLDAAEILVRRLTELGCGVALDDFGTGYGSFTYLKRLPVTELKINMEFIDKLVEDEANQRVVMSIVGAAKNFGLKTVAEGVEDEHVVELLRALGVDMVQGYYVGYPSRVSRSPEAVASLGKSTGGAETSGDEVPPASVSLAALGPDRRPPVQKTTLAVAQELFEAIARGDQDAVIAALDPEVEWIPSPWSGVTARGHEAVRAWMLQFGEGLTHLAVKLELLEQRDQRVLALGTVVDSRGEEPFAIRVGWIFSFRGDRVIKASSHPGWAAARAAIGGSPSTAPRPAAELISA